MLIENYTIIFLLLSFLWYSLGRIQLTVVSNSVSIKTSSVIHMYGRTTCILVHVYCMTGSSALVRMHTLTCINTGTHSFMYVYTCPYAHACSYAQTHLQMHRYSLSHVCTYTRTGIHMQRAQVHTRPYMHTCECAHAHAHTHTIKYTPPPPII